MSTSRRRPRPRRSLPLAIRALDRIVSPDSELRERWEKSEDHAAWTDAIRGLRGRLGGQVRTLFILRRRRALLQLAITAVACGRYPVRSSECGTTIVGTPQTAFMTSSATAPDPARRSVIVHVREHAARSGQPIDGALVTISRDSAWQARQPLVAAETGPDGSVALRVDQDGKYFVRIAAPGYRGTLVAVSLRSAAGDTLAVRLPFEGCLIR